MESNLITATVLDELADSLERIANVAAPSDEYPRGRPLPEVLREEAARLRDKRKEFVS